VKDRAGTGNWVLLCYRLPREPSTPRITAWRKLKRLGVAQLSDGMVALPADARTREQLEWIADEILQAGGDASIWLSQPATAGQERDLARRMASARAEEYTAIIAEARAIDDGAGPRERRRLADRLRAELRRIGRRDYFPPPERDAAHAAVRALLDPTATDATATEATATEATATDATATDATATDATATDATATDATATDATGVEANLGDADSDSEADSGKEARP
jgi:hypothetical protein